MASTGQRTAVVERKLIGGSCPNTNCLPSKNEIWSAKVADLTHHADRFGTITRAVAVDMAKVLAHKREMVDGLIAMHLERYRASVAELIMGTGRFVAPKTIEVSLNDGGSRVLSGDNVVINVGTHATIPDIAGLHAAAALTNVEVMELDRLPQHLVGARRRLCRAGAGAGLSPLWQPGDRHRKRPTDRRSRGPRRRGRDHGDACR